MALTISTSLTPKTHSSPKLKTCWLSWSRACRMLSYKPIQCVSWNKNPRIQSVKRRKDTARTTNWTAMMRKIRRYCIINLRRKISNCRTWMRKSSVLTLKWQRRRCFARRPRLSCRSKMMRLKIWSSNSRFLSMSTSKGIGTWTEIIKSPWNS